MKIWLPVVVLLAIAAVLFTGCNLVGSGPIQEKEYQITDFSEIEISHDFQYTITHSDSYKIVVSTHQNLIDSLDIYRSGQTLKVRFKAGNIANSDAKATITLPNLERLQASGASKGIVKGFESKHDFDLEVSGASQVDMDIKAEKTTIEISGASKVYGSLESADTRIKVSGASNCGIKGSTGPANIEVSGASHADVPDLKLQDVSVEVSGASGASINTSGTLDLQVSGASTLNYYGNPVMGKMDVSGASQIHKK